MTGARVVVLGGSGELGSRIASRLSAAGAHVLLVGRDEQRLAATAGALDAAMVTADLRRLDAPARIIDAAVEQLGGIDGLVNAAGVVAFGPLGETDDATLDEIFTTDLIGPLRVIRGAVAAMEGGFVVNLTGVVAENPPARMVAYSAAKAGLSAATKALSRELRRDGIRFLDARPPHTETGLANRPIAGEAPTLPPGLDPDAVVDRIIDALSGNARELAAEDFA